MVYCGVYWVTTLPGCFNGQSSDCYIWEGGTDTQPDAVLGVVTGIVFGNVPNWPTIGQNDVDLNTAVTGPFTVGYWPNWPGSYAGFYCAADLDGVQGHPWTCIAPDSGFLTGWQDPSMVYGSTRSMGCGVYFLEGGTPIESGTWGAVKVLFAR